MKIKKLLRYRIKVLKDNLKEYKKTKSLGLIATIHEYEGRLDELEQLLFVLEQEKT